MPAPSPYPLLKNVRDYVRGRIESRPGLVSLATIADPIHSIKRLNDDVPGAPSAFSRIVGAGTKLYSGSGALTLRDSGYSGNPLSMVQLRPEQSPQSWIYVADALRMRKIKVDGSNFQMGIAPPLVAPTLEFGPDAMQILSDFDAIGAWVNGGTAGAISVVTRFSSTITAWFYDSAGAANTSSGMASFALASASDQLRPGATAIIAGFFTVKLQDVLPGFTATITSRQNVAVVTLGAVLYNVDEIHLGTVSMLAEDMPFAPPVDWDTPDITDPEERFLTRRTSRIPIRRHPSTPGTIRQPAGGRPLGVKRGTLVKINTTGNSVNDYGWISEVTPGTDGSISILFIYRSTATISIFQPQTTFRANFPVNTSLLAGNVVSGSAFQFSVTQGIGFVTLTSAFDLSHVTSIVGGTIRPVQEDDEIHISIRMDHPEFLSEGRILFDVDSAVNDFSRNYFYKAFRASDLQASVLSNQSVLGGRQSSFGRDVIDNVGRGGIRQSFGAAVAPGEGPPQRGDRSRGGEPLQFPIDIRFGKKGKIPVSDQAETGTSQWTELKFKVSDLARVGADRSRTLANVAAIRIQFQTSGTVVAGADALWIAGSYGPDIGDLGAPLLYRYRGRSKLTGAKSNPSPATRNGFEAHRQAILVTMTQHPDTQVDTLDIFRWGGALSAWTYVGSVPNSASPQFNDIYQDLDISNGPLLEFDNFQPFPTIDIPRTGTVNVTGTRVTWVSGDQFNVNWSPGTQININGILYALYNQPSSVTALELVENAGTQTGVPYYINQATILGQALPALWGPYSQGSALFLFACGDLYQPGTLFITKGNNPDSAPDTLQMEVTSPSEPLMNGCIYDGVSYVWSSERLFILYPSFQGGFRIEGGALLPQTGTNLFTPQDVRDEKGLLARWFFCVGPKLWYGAKDGIHELGNPVPITAEQLYLLFPHDGVAGQAVTIGTATVQPPDFTQAAKLRLSHSDGFLFFDYLDINGKPTTLVYNTLTRIWGIDQYNISGVNQGILTHYYEEGRGIHSLLAGGTDGNLYQLQVGQTDNGNAFVTEIRMPQGADFSGYLHFRDLYASIISAAGVSLIINFDGVDTLITLPQTSTYQKSYSTLPALKGKVMSIGLTNSPQATPANWTLVSREELILKGKRWGDSGAYQDLRPFQDLGARSRITPTS